MDEEDVWEAAALRQLKADVAAYPGGIQKFAADHRERLGVGPSAFGRNLNGAPKMSLRTYLGAVRALGFTPAQYEARISQLLEADRKAR